MQVDETFFGQSDSFRHDGSMSWCGSVFGVFRFHCCNPSCNLQDSNLLKNVFHCCKWGEVSTTRLPFLLSESESYLDGEKVTAKPVSVTFVHFCTLLYTFVTLFSSNRITEMHTLLYVSSGYFLVFISSEIYKLLVIDKSKITRDIPSPNILVYHTFPFSFPTDSPTNSIQMNLDKFNVLAKVWFYTIHVRRSMILNIVPNVFILKCSITR